MTTNLRTTTSTPTGNGASPPGRFELEPPPKGPARTRWPEITLGVMVVAIFALAGAWFYSSASDADAVLALRNPVDRGHIITNTDLVVVEVATEDQLNTLSREQASAIIGQIAMTDLSAGTLVSADLFAARASIAEGNGVVGLALDPGEYPTLALRPGDLVRVVETPRQGEPTGAEIVLVEVAEVVDVAAIGVQNQFFVSLSMTTAEADAVAAADSQDRVRLIQVAGD